jgi:hypothetical protein
MALRRPAAPLTHRSLAKLFLDPTLHISLPELDHGLGVATVTVDSVEKACCSFDSQEFGKALSRPHITHKNRLDIVVEFVF